MPRVSVAFASAVLLVVIGLIPAEAAFSPAKPEVPDAVAAQAQYPGWRGRHTYHPGRRWRDPGWQWGY